MSNPARSSTKARRSSHVSMIAVTAFFAAAQMTHAQNLNYPLIGDLPVGDTRAVAYDVSDDGSVVVGYGNNSNFRNQAFKMSNGVMAPLSTSSSDFGEAHGVSSDGSVVVGVVSSAIGTEAVVWQNGTRTPLPYLSGSGPYRYGIARAVSKDGKVIVGSSASQAGQAAFRWANGTMSSLGDLPGGTIASVAYDVSADGSVVVGKGSTAIGDEAFRWEKGNMVGLGTLPGESDSTARAVSADGSVVVGYSDTRVNNTAQAFRWENGTMTGLGYLETGPEKKSYAYDVSADGSIVVGAATSQVTKHTQAFRWSQTAGMQGLGSLLEGEGVDLSGITLTEAHGISSDGRFIVGRAQTQSGQEAFLAVYEEPVATAAATATTPDPAATPDPTPAPAGVIFVNDFTTSANSVSNTSRMSGASGQSLDSGLEFAGLNSGADDSGSGSTVSTQGTAPVFGGLSYSGFVFGEGARMLDTSSATRQVGYGGAGVMVDARSAGLRFGLAALAASQKSTTTALGSTSQINGRGVGLWIAYAPAPTGLELMLTASRLNLDATINRNYLNGATTESSSGQTNGTYTGVQARIGYAMQSARNIVFKPYVALSNSTSRMGGYTETGGTFAGTVTSQSSTVNKKRIGLDARYKLRPNLELTGGLSFDAVSETGSFAAVNVTNLAGAAFGGGSGGREYKAVNLAVGLNAQVSQSVTLHTQIDMSRALSSGAADINKVGVKLGATIRF